MRIPAITKQRGFTLVEMVFSLVIAMVVLVAMVQLMVRSNSMFVRVKDRSDRIIDKTLVKEQIDFYMDRWGQGVGEKALSPPGAFPPASRFSYVLTPNKAYSTAGAEVSNAQFDSFEFLGNLEGYAVVNDIAGNKANLLSCRLQTAMKNNANGCYTILREGDYWVPDDVKSNQLSVLGGLDLSGVSNALDLNKKTFTYARLENFSRLNNTKECIDQTSYETNAQIDKTVTFKTGEATTVGSGGTLEEGDFIQPLPQKIRLFVKNNENDKRNYWLYIASTPISDCGETVTEVAPVAPVRRFKVDDSNAGVIQVEVALGYEEAIKTNQSGVETLLNLEYYYGS